MNANFFANLFSNNTNGLDDDFLNNLMGSIQNVGGFSFTQNMNFDPQSGGNKPPPKASDLVLAKLPRVKVTDADLIEENNKTCCICLDDMHVGKEAVKLGCGHIFDEECITDWLKKTCTCPICRYELGTDDKDFEEGRKKRMRERKMRFRENELETYKVGQLKEIMRQNSIPTTGCIDKNDLVERIKNSERVDILSGIEKKQFSISTLRNSSIKELKNLLLGVGLGDDLKGSLEKEEIVQIIVNSDKFIILPELLTDIDASISSSSSQMKMDCDEGEDGEDEAPATKTRIVETSSSSSGNGSGSSGGNNLSRMMSVDGSYVTSSTSVGERSEDEDENGEDEVEEDALAQAMSLSPASSLSSSSNTVYSSSSNAAASGTSNDGSGTSSMSVKELLGIANAMGINTSRCLDKADLLVALRDAGMS